MLLNESISFLELLGSHVSSGALPVAFLEYSKVRGHMLHLMTDVESLNDRVLEEKKNREAYGQEISGIEVKRVKSLKVQSLVARRKGKG